MKKVLRSVIFAIGLIMLTIGLYTEQTETITNLLEKGISYLR